jgi:uncharacterized membrane protein
MTVQTDRLVDDYLRDLEKAAAHLPRARRTELVAEIREHIESALRERDPTDETAVRNVLERLGRPQEIAESAGPPPSAPARAEVRDVGALIALLIPFVGWLIGAVLVLVSRAWPQRDKVIGLVLLFLPIVVLGLGLTLSSPSGGEESLPPGVERPVGMKEEAPPEGIGLFTVVLFASGVPSVLYLGWRLRPDRRTEPTQT